MISKVIMTKRASEQLNKYVKYIKKRFKNDSAASSVLQDARDTKATLLNVADSLKYCEDTDLRAPGYRTVHFRKHRYFFVYEIRNNIAYIEAVYHDLQDYENIFKSAIL